VSEDRYDYGPAVANSLATVTIVPDDFEVPHRFETESFVLEPLGPEHNERDFEAWASSIDHIRATPGFAGRRWPHSMPPAENLADLERHCAEFYARTAFAYTVLGPQTHDVIGCVYIDPDAAGAGSVTVRSWVSFTHAHLDEWLHETVVGWLESDWPFASVSTARE